MTESEVLIKLVEEATNKGERIQKENKRLRRRAKKILELLPPSEEVFLKESKLPRDYEPTQICTVGIDGSFYLVGGVGGRWYSPYGIARILYEEGLVSGPRVDIYSAGIEEIQEQETPNVRTEASLRMLIGEAKAIDNWGAKNIPSIVFIDGPIVDPPTYTNKEYIEDRCKAIKNCLNNSLVIGCVKRSRDAFFVKYFEDLLKTNEKDIEMDFISDQHIFAYFFSDFRFENNYNGFLCSRVIDISDYGINGLYKENGVHILTFFYQKSIDARILRIDIPILGETLKNIDEIVLKVMKASSDWQYPKQDMPLPVELAHEKCKVREGAAEVLYEEILTKSRSSDIEDQIIMLQLR